MWRWAFWTRATRHNDLGDLVLREACQGPVRWRNPLRSSVNVSPPQFEREDNFERLMQIVHESGLPTDRLELEITERTALRDIDHTRELTTRITETGIRLSIDDFGAGSTSLRYLRDLPLSTLKIDQAFILTLGENPANAAIAASVVSLGHKLNLNVIAEGVETLEQLEVLRSQDCDEFQGFLASRPVPPEDFRAIVDADRPMVADPA